MSAYKRERLLKWVDKNSKGTQNEPKKPLANLIPIQETINFSYIVNTHHEKTCGDIKSCMRGAKINK